MEKTVTPAIAGGPLNLSHSRDLHGRRLEVPERELWIKEYKWENPPRNPKMVKTGQF